MVAIEHEVDGMQDAEIIRCFDAQSASSVVGRTPALVQDRLLYAIEYKSELVGLGSRLWLQREGLRRWSVPGAATQALLAGDGRTTESGALLVERKQPSQVTAKAAYWVLLSVQRLAACCLVGS